MTIISISRGSFSKGREVAEKVADRLGYLSISREVILEASTDYHVPKSKLDRAIHDAPSLIERITYEKQKYVAYVAAEILRYYNKDDVVYHGLAGHFFGADVAHHLRVRIIANMEERILALMKRDTLSRKNAQAILERDDRERKAWSRDLYGIDTSDNNLYDLIIHVDKLTVDDAADLICDTAARSQFKATAESLDRIGNLALAAAAKAKLINDYPNCEVMAEGSAVEVSVRISAHAEKGAVENIEAKVRTVPNVTDIQVNVIPSTLFG